MMIVPLVSVLVIVFVPLTLGALLALLSTSR